MITYIYLANRPGNLYQGDQVLMEAWFLFYQEQGYHPVRVSAEKAQQLLVQDASVDNEQWEVVILTTTPPED